MNNQDMNEEKRSKWKRVLLPLILLLFIGFAVFATIFWGPSLWGGGSEETTTTQGGASGTAEVVTTSKNTTTTRAPFSAPTYQTGATTTKDKSGTKVNWPTSSTATTTTKATTTTTTKAAATTTTTKASTTTTTKVSTTSQGSGPIYTGSGDDLVTPEVDGLGGIATSGLLDILTKIFG